MNKIVKISESQFKDVVRKTLNEEVEGNIVTSFGKSIIDSILKGGVLYDKDCPDIFIDKPTLLVNHGDYTVYIIGDTDSLPTTTQYNKGDYFTPPEGGDIIWIPKKFYLIYIYDILKNNSDHLDDEYIEAISDYVIDKLPKINIDHKYKIVVNTEDVENDDYDIDPYDDINDR